MAMQMPPTTTRFLSCEERNTMCLRTLAANAAAIHFDALVDRDALDTITKTKPLYVMTVFSQLPAAVQIQVLESLDAQGESPHHETNAPQNIHNHGQKHVRFQQTNIIALICEPCYIQVPSPQDIFKFFWTHGCRCWTLVVSPRVLWTILYSSQQHVVRGITILLHIYLYLYMSSISTSIRI